MFGDYRDIVATTGDVYERELKALLSGDKKAVTKMVRTCNSMETAGYNTMLIDPFMVTRAAGSLGVDLVAMRWDFSFPIEVKSSDDPHWTRAHLVPIYAYRLKGFRGDPWRIFTIPTEHCFKGKNAILYRRLPKFDVSASGNYIMRWEDGMKLSDFILYTGNSDYNAF